VPLVGFNILAEFLWATDDPLRYGGFTIISYLLIFFLIGVAIYRARRYRLSRTVWRGIRPALVGRSSVYGLLYLAIYLLNGATMGWSYPWGRIRLTEQMMRETYFGDRPFRFEARSGSLYGRFAVFWFGSIGAVILASLVVGVIGATAELQLDEKLADEPLAVAWTAALIVSFLLVFGVPVATLYAFYKARELALIAESTAFEGLAFRFDVTTGSLMWLVLGNYLITILTLTLGYPFVQLRNFRYLCQRLQAVGTVDFEAIRQSTAERPSVGEGLADAFDVGAV
jgi:uncharacterized membrane protein YjgN (DUF898 family)